MASIPIRSILDGLYKLGGIFAALCLIGILLVIVLQMALRWLLIPFPGSANYAGYLMAWASFFAFAYTLNSDAHIRVTLLLKALGKQRFWGEIWCFVLGSIASVYLAYHSCKLIYWSVKFNDVSQGQDATPLWMAQLPVAAGSILLAICFVDNLVSLLFLKRDNIKHEALLDKED